MVRVPDVRATVRWYQSIGFVLEDAYEEDGALVFARLTLGSGEFAISVGGESELRAVSIWFFTDRVQELYEAMRARPHEAGGVAAATDAEIRFEEDLYTPFYGGQQFSIRDINGMALVFWQPEWLSPASRTPGGENLA
jgi:hypothetical protein